MSEARLFKSEISGVSENKNNMSKIFWNALKLSPVILGATLLLANRTSAAETPVVVELAPNSSVSTTSESLTAIQPAVSNAQVSAQNPTFANSPTVEVAPEVKLADLPQASSTPQQLAEKPAEGFISQPSQNNQVPAALDQTTSVSQLSTTQTPDALAQVTSVSQLSDVQPTDWAFQALQSLVERYGCIAGYPDGTYRGNRALTRYEFAAGLNSCLDRVNELIATATADLVRREDLATLQRLQEEFSAELATLRGRVDSLEAQTAELEANQFSTTTKLNGEVVAALSDVFSDEAVGGTDLEYNTIFAARARLNFDTSFTGEDRLRIRLQAANIDNNSDDTGTAMTRLGFDTDTDNEVEIDDFFYRFPLLNNKVLAQIDFANVEFNDNVYTFNPAFESSGRGAISRFGRFNPIYRQGQGGAGATLTFNPEGAISASVGYLSPTADNPDSGFGVFNGAYAALGQISIKPTDFLNIGLTYAHSYQNQGDVDLFGDTGSALSQDPFGGAATSANHYGVEASLRLGRTITVGGWGGLTYATAEDGPGDVTRGDKATAYNWAATLAIQDFGLEGSQLGVIFGQPPKLSFNQFGADDEDTSYHLEGLYRLQLTDNIAVTPGVIVIFNPEHSNDNEDIFVGTVRTTFTF